MDDQVVERPFLFSIMSVISASRVIEGYSDCIVSEVHLKYSTLVYLFIAPHLGAANKGVEYLRLESRTKL